MKEITNPIKRVELCQFKQEDSQCNGVDTFSLIVHKKKVKKRKKYDQLRYGLLPEVSFRLSRSGINKYIKNLTEHTSMPDINKRTKLSRQRTRSSEAIFKRRNIFNTKFVVNRLSGHYYNEYLSPFNFPTQRKWKVYRCQLGGSVRDTCCCSCNSDAMFEVMKSLYDCYKMKNCNNCKCILCGHLPQEERLLGEVRKSVLVAAPKERKAQIKKAERALRGKSKEEKEKILRELAQTGQPLPEGKTASEKALIQKVRADLGLPPAPKTASHKAKMKTATAAGVVTPLEGKTPSQKEKILKAQAKLGIQLPEGRTASEKALIEKVKAATEKPVQTPSEKIRKAKAAGLITPLTGKTPEQREKILRGLAMEGIPLPEGQTASEKKIIEKVRADLGLPPEPKTQSMKDKHAKAADVGLLQPLEGKSPKEKETILQGLHDMGIPLPEGRTASEKAIIAKVKAGPRAAPTVLTPSEKLRKAKAEGLITPLAGKTPAQREKILRGLAMQGIPLPEGKTASEKKIIDKVRTDLGLPPEPKTPSMREKYNKAADAGLLQPLEGKQPEEKEKILQGLYDMGIPLPEGRTASEKSLIKKIKSKERRKSKAAKEVDKFVAPPGVEPERRPSEKLRAAKAAGLLTPLEGKTPEQREKIIRGLAMQGIPLPEGKTASERKIISKVRADLGLPPEPKTQSMREKHNKAADAGLLQPLEGKSPKEKEKILQGLHDMGIPLPEGRTASEKAIIAKVKAGPRAAPVLAPSEKLRRAKAEGLLTPLAGKTPAQREKILRGLAMQGIPLPEGKTASERKIIDKVRADLGLPPEPKTPSMKEKHKKAADLGLLQPLEGKSADEKEKILQHLHDMGIPLPEGRTPSEKALIAKVKAEPRAVPVLAPELAPSEKLRKAKAQGLLTPLAGKTPEQREKILRGLAMEGIALPEGKTASEKKIIDKVRADLGLPPEPKTQSMREKHNKAADAGLLQPLEGKSPKEKEKILQGLHDMGIPLPEGRTASEKAIIAKVKAGPRAAPVLAPSEKLRRAKAEGLLTPLAGKTPAQREKILRGLANQGIPLPEGKTASEKQLIDKVRADLGLPPEPKTQSMREKHNKAADAGLLQPLEGKSPKEKEKILQGLHDMGIPLPEGRTASEKAIIAKVKAGPRAAPVLAPSEKLRRAKAEGLLTPLAGKTPAQREKILRGLANQGIPLPEGKTASEKQLIDKVRADLGLPPEPKTQSMREKHNKAAEAGLLQPLEGKSPKEKEKILQGLHDMGIPLPEGRTASEKALINKIKSGERKKPKPALTPEEIKKLDKKTAKVAKEGKGPVDECICGLLAPGIEADKIPSEKLRAAKAAGLLTPLEGKTPEQKEKIIRGLAMQGIPLPEGKTASEKKLIDKVRADVGLPPEPKTASMKEKHAKAANLGFLQPLEGKSPKEKEAILKGLHDMGIPLPEGRTASEKALIAKVKAEPRAAPALAPSEKLRKAKAEGLLTPLAGKTPEQKEKILRGLAMQGIPLPEGQTASEKKLIDKVRADVGLPPEPKTQSMREKHAKAANLGLLQPLEGKPPKEKEAILKGLHDMGIPLPEGRTASEKALIAKVKAEARAAPVLAPSEKLRKAKAQGLLTPLAGKTPEQKEKILRGLAMQGIPLPEGQTASEKKIIDKVRADVGLPPEPKTASMKEKHAKAADLGLLQPLEGKSPQEKERILQGLHDMGIPLPEGRTASEKALIDKVKAEPRAAPVLAPSEKLRKAKAQGLLTPLAGKTPEQRENILRGLAMEGIALPEGRTASEKKIIDKVRADLGLPPEPKTQSMREKHNKAADAGLLQPLEGKSPKEKEKILQGLHDMGIPLPEGRTASEKAIIAKVKAGPRAATVLAPSEKLRRAKAEGLMTPLAGKTPAQREKILRGLAKQGIPLPEGKTASEKKIIDKVRADLGLPPEPKTQSMREKHNKAAEAGLLQPLEGKSPKEKEKILQGLHDMGIPLPEGRTASEKAIIAKVKAGPRAATVLAPSEKLRRAKAEGLMTPLAGKTPAQREKILRGLAKQGIPLPEGKTASEKKIIDKVRADLGLPPEPKTQSMREKHNKAADAGLLQPLEGKSPKEKERILQGLHDMGIPLPEGRTTSEKALINKIKSGERRKPMPVLTPEEIKKLDKKTAKVAKEGKGPVDECICGLLAPGVEPERISEKLRAAKAAGLLTPLEGKTPEQKEKIIRGLAMQGIPLPEGKTTSEKILIDKVRADLGLPPEPKTASMKEKHAKAADLGLLQPLEGKPPQEKERILQGLHDMGIPLPEGRTASEKALIAKVKSGPRAEPVLAPSEKLRRAKAEGLLTPLEGKPPAQKEKILRGLAMKGIPLPEGKTASERKLIDKVRADLGLPPEPKTASMKEKHAKAADLGLLQPLEGKPPQEKERILQGLHNMGIPLPEGRTASEKELIAKVKAEPRAAPVLAPAEKLQKAKALGLMTPLAGKTPEQRENILRGLAMEGIALPEGRTASEKKIIDKVRADLGLPPEPKTASMREKHNKAADAGLLQPLEGKSPQEKEKILQGLHDMGIPLPEGRTASEKAIIAKVKAGPRAATVLAPSEKLRRAKAEGLMTPLAGKTPAQREKILRGLAKQGIPLPEGKTASEKQIIDKVRADLGLPPEPKTQSMREKHNKAADAGLLQPLEGKSPKEKEKILQGLHDMGIPLPEGRTASEKAIIAKVKAGPRAATVLAPSEKLRRAKAEGLMTPLAGKTPAQREKILRGLAKQGIPLPEGKTASEKQIIDKVRADLGLPPEPKSQSMREKHNKAADAGLLQPLEGKSPKEKEKILQGLHDMGIPLPEGRTASEKAIIAKVKAGPRAATVLAPSEKLRRAKAEGLMTPLAGKTPAQREKILRGLAKQGIPLPEGKTASEKQIIDKVRADLGLPPEPKTQSMREKHNKAADAGLLQPLEGKSPKEKERILQGLHDMGIPLPEGRTTSEKALINKIKSGERRKPLPVLTPEEIKKLDKKTAKVAKEGKGPVDECICGLLAPGVEPDKIPSEKLRAAKAAGLLTPLEGKTPEQKEKILRGLVKQGLPLPESKTASEKKIIDKVRLDLGLPPEPKTPSMKEKYRKAQASGLITPLEGKTKAQKEKILRGQAKLGLPLPEGRTASEKSLIAKIKTSAAAPSITTEKLRKAKAAGLLTPLEGKSPEQKEKILRGLAESGLPLPEGRTASEKAMVKKIKADLKIPERTPSEKIRRAKVAGLLTPLEGKTHSQKEKILRGRAAAGLPLPVGRTPSERALIQKIKADTGYVSPTRSERIKRAKAAGLLTPLEGKTPSTKEKILRERVAAGVPISIGKTPSEQEIIRKITAGEPPAKRKSEKLREAKAAGALTPLEGKTRDQKEKILRGLIKAGLPMPEPKTASEKDLMEKIRKDVGLPPEPKTASLKEKYRKAQDAGIMTPLEGKTKSQKEAVLKKLHDAGIPLPEGRTASEKSMVKRIKAGLPPAKITSEKLQKAKAAGLLTPLKGKTPQEKERILRGLIEQGLPLPEAQTASEKKIADKVRREVGLPPEPKTASEKERLRKAQTAGIVTPLEGKTASEKEKIIRNLAEAGVALPEGRTASEKAMIKRVAAEVKKKPKEEPEKISSKKLRAAKAAGLITPLEGKSAAQKEKIIRGLADAGMPLPEGKTESEKALIQKVRTELGIPPPAKTASEKSVVRKAKAEGLLTPLAGKSAKEKERIVKGLVDAGLPVPEGKTPSEKEMIKKVRTAAGLPPEATPSEKRGGIRTKSKRVGVTPSKREAKTKVAGIDEQFEDVIKTTTCDRGCGCDKKKIRFKHSYVKIRVTSPDISSLCPCPDECVPGVKAGAFIDNEGIKVTVGRVVGTASFTRKFSNHVLETSKHVITLYDKRSTNIFSSNTSIDTVDSSFEINCLKKAVYYDACPSLRGSINDNSLNDLDTSVTYNSGLSESSTSNSIYEIEKHHSDVFHYTLSQESCTDESERFIDTCRNVKPWKDIHSNQAAISFHSVDSCIMADSKQSSCDSVPFIESESSLSLVTNSTEESMDVISVISFSNSSCNVQSSVQYLLYPINKGIFSDSTIEEIERLTNYMNYSNNGSSDDTIISYSSSEISDTRFSRPYNTNRKQEPVFSRTYRHDYFAYRLSQTELDMDNNIKGITTKTTTNGEPVVVINNLDSQHDIKTMVDQLLSNNDFPDASSIIVVVPTSDESENSSSTNSSTTCMQLSKNYVNFNQMPGVSSERPGPATPNRNISSTTHGLKISSKGKKYCLEGMEEPVASSPEDTNITIDASPQIIKQSFEQRARNLCQMFTSKRKVKVFCGMGTDTMDRPCCCPEDPKKRKSSRVNRCVANVAKVVSPLLLNQGRTCDKHKHSHQMKETKQAPIKATQRVQLSVSRCMIPPECRITPCHNPPPEMAAQLHKRHESHDHEPHVHESHDQEPQVHEPRVHEPRVHEPRVHEPRVHEPRVHEPHVHEPRVHEPRVHEPHVEKSPPVTKPPQPCQCSPEKLREMLDQAVKAGKALNSNFKTTGCGSSCDEPIQPLIGSSTPKPIPTPIATIKDPCIPQPMQCECSGKKKSKKSRYSCPCEQYKPQMSGAANGPKPGTVSQGCQCCACKESSLKDCPGLKSQGLQEGTTEILGPAGGWSQVEPGGTCCQAGQIQAQIGTITDPCKHETSKSCTCKSKQKKKDNNVICQCPVEPEPEVYHYVFKDERQILKEQSDLTQTQSGFRVFKKKKPPVPPEEPFTVEDAVRYYAVMNPDILKDLCPPPKQFCEGNTSDCECKEVEKKRKKKLADCDCPYEPPPPPEPEKVDDGPSGGIKLSLGGKGSGSKGLSGICCFDLMHETKMSISKTHNSKLDNSHS